MISILHTENSYENGSLSPSPSQIQLLITSLLKQMKEEGDETKREIEKKKEHFDWEHIIFVMSMIARRKKWQYHCQIFTNLAVWLSNTQLNVVYSMWSLFNLFFYYYYFENHFILLIIHVHITTISCSPFKRTE